MCVCVCVCVYVHNLLSLVVQMVRSLPAMWDIQVRSLDQEDPLEKEMATHSTPVFLSRKSHGWRSLVGCNPWGHRQSDTTEQLTLFFIYVCVCVYSIRIYSSLQSFYGDKKEQSHCFKLEISGG